VSSLIRGQPEGDTPRERLDNWLGAKAQFDNMTWVGKNYSLAQLKLDVAEVLREPRGSACFCDHCGCFGDGCPCCYCGDT
jgi:hypothetical protein